MKEILLWTWDLLPAGDNLFMFDAFIHISLIFFCVFIILGRVDDEASTSVTYMIQVLDGLQSFFGGIDVVARNFVRTILLLI